MAHFSDYLQIKVKWYSIVVGDDDDDVFVAVRCLA